MVDPPSAPPTRIRYDLMRLATAARSSKPIPDRWKTVVDSVSPNHLRQTVERIAVPRVSGSPECRAVRGTIVELFQDALRAQGGGSGVQVDEAGNVIWGDPCRARVLLGAHYDAVPGTPGADDNAS